MRRLVKFHWRALALMVAVLGSAAAALAAEKVPGDRRFPADTVVYLDVRSISEFKQQWPQTLLGQMLQQKEMEPFLAEFKAPLNQLSEKIHQQIGISLEDLLKVPQGEVAVAVLPPTADTLPAAVLLDFGENRETVDKLLEKAAKELEDHDAKRSEVNFDDTQIVVFTFPAPKAEEGDEAPAKPSPRVVAYFEKDTDLVISNSVDMLKGVLTRWDGKQERTLAESSVYRYVLDRTSPADEASKPSAIFFADPITLVRSALTAAGQTNPQAAFIQGLIPTLGLDKFKGLGGTVEFVTKDFDSISRFLVYFEPPKTGLLKIFEFPTSANTPPKWVSARSSNYMRLNWDVETAYDAIRTLYDNFAGEDALERMIEQLASAEGGPHVNLKKDVIDQMAGTFRVTSEVTDPDKLGSERYLVAVELKDEAAFSKTLAAIAKTEGFPGKPRDFQGTTIYEFPVSKDEDEKEDKDSGPAPTPAIAVTHKNLMFTSDVALIERVIREDSTQEALADTPEYQRVARFYPEKTSSISYQRSDVQLRALYEMLRSGQADQLLGDIKIDFSKLPPFEVIRPFLTPSGSYMVPDDKGLFFSSFTLRKGTQE